jgi:hypothetical protein
MVKSNLNNTEEMAFRANEDIAKRSMTGSYLVSRKFIGKGSIGAPLPQFE